MAYFDTGKPAVRAAKAKDIPVAIADTSITGVDPQSSGYENYKVFMGPNDEQAGYDQAKALIAATSPVPTARSTCSDSRARSARR